MQANYEAIIGFTGDFCPINRLDLALKNNNWEQGFSSIKPLLRSSHLNIVDLECPLTNSTEKIIKTGPHLKGNPEGIRILKHLNCSLVATANNHFMDYGASGMRQTFNVLKENNVDWVGSGKSQNEASMAFTKEINGLGFSFINMTENEWTTTHDDQAGCNPLDLPRAFQIIQEAKKRNDFVVVILHGGHEHYNLPSPEMKKRFRFMVDAGADAVVGHHTHIFSGFEVYRNKPIFYSLGNFCFDWENKRNDPWNVGLYLQLIFTKDGTSSFKFEFVRQNDEKVGVYLINGDEKEKLNEQLLLLNKIIQDDSQLSKCFEEYISKQSDVMLARIQPYSGRLAPSLFKRKLLPDLLGKRKRKLLLALMQCESHRDILIQTLRREVK